MPQNLHLLRHNLSRKDALSEGLIAHKNHVVSWGVTGRLKFPFFWKKSWTRIVVILDLLQQIKRFHVCTGVNSYSKTWDMLNHGTYGPLLGSGLILHGRSNTESVYEYTYNVMQPSVTQSHKHFFQIQIATKLCQPFKMQMNTSLVFQAHSNKPKKLEGHIQKSPNLQVIWKLLLIDA